MGIYRPTAEYTPDNSVLNTRYTGELPGGEAPTGTPVPGVPMSGLLGQLMQGIQSQRSPNRPRFNWRDMAQPYMNGQAGPYVPPPDVPMTDQPPTDLKGPFRTGPTQGGSFLDQIMREDPTDPRFPGGNGISQALRKNPAMNTWLTAWVNQKRQQLGR
jgi:hypothetical protein